MRASYNGHTDIVRILIEANAHLNIQDKEVYNYYVSDQMSGDVYTLVLYVAIGMHFVYSQIIP